jgi:uncharacterized Zn-binding protein involved in type VI secretion
MFAAGRKGDKSHTGADAHGCPSCPHAAQGGATSGSGHVFINGFSALRVGDTGEHSHCCGPNTWKALGGAPAVFIDGKPAHRAGDRTKHCGGKGSLIEGSPDVFIGDLVVSTKKPRLDGHDRAYLKKIAWHAGTAAINGLKHGPKYALASALGAAAGDGILFGVGKVFGLLDHVWKGLGTFLKKAFWKITEALHLDNLARWFCTNFFQRLFHGWHAIGQESCPEQQTTYPPRPVEELTFANETLWILIPSNVDISKGVVTLLEAYKPIFIEHPDDLRAIALEELLACGSTLEPLPEGVTDQPTTLEDYRETLAAYAKQPEKEDPKKKDEDDTDDEPPDPCAPCLTDGPVTAPTDADTSSPRGGAADYDPTPITNDHDANLVIPEAVARGEEMPDGSAQYYGRATKVTPNMIQLEYFALRAGSFLPGSEINQDFFEHGGDGEGCFVILRRADAGAPWLLSGVSFPGKHVGAKCCNCGDQASVSEDPSQGYAIPAITDGGRPLAFVATGSHAIAPTPGMRNSGLGTVDFYPSVEDGRRVESYTLRTSDEYDVRLGVLTKQVWWGTAYIQAPGIKPYNGKSYVPEYRDASNQPLGELDLWANPENP